jgi:hypothetical protein
VLNETHSAARLHEVAYVMVRRLWFHFVLCCIALSPSFASAQLAPPPDGSSARGADVDPRVERAFETDERAGVFLMLRATGETTAHVQRTVIDALGADFEVWHRYGSIPALAGELTRSGLARARVHADITAIQLDGTGTGGLKEALPATGVDKVHAQRGLTGKGITVAVLDSGAPSQHPALKDAIVAQHCFTSSACPPNNAREGESAEDDHNHGSNVTGIVASRGGGGVAVGYAPGASIVAVKVLNRSNAGRVSDWVAGFDWVSTNVSMLNVKVINASLVSTQEYATAADCDRGEGALAAVTKKLIDAGVTITASSGNTGHTETMTAPACNTGVIAVGATYDTDLGRQPEQGGTYQALGGAPWPACSDATTNAKTIACFTSTAGARLDVLAPGSQMTSAGKGTGTSMFRGTSQASPGVAGLSALLLECNPALTPSKILEVLKATGEPIMDPRSGMSYPLIRGVQAVEMACPMGAPVAGAGAIGTAGIGGPSAGAPPAAGSGVIVVPVAGATAAGSGALIPAPGGTVVPSTGAAAPGTSSRTDAASIAGMGGGVTSAAGAIAPLQVDRLPAKDAGCHVARAPGTAGTARATWIPLASFALVVAARRRTKRRRR